MSYKLRFLLYYRAMWQNFIYISITKIFIGQAYACDAKLKSNTAIVDDHPITCADYHKKSTYRLAQI